MSSVIIKRILIIVVFTVLAVADFSLNIIGYNVGVSLSLYLYVYLISINRIHDFVYFFVFGLLLDLVSTISPFGFFAIAFLAVGAINKWLSSSVPQEFLSLGYYVICIIIFNALFGNLSLIIILTSVISYLCLRIISLGVFKK